MNIERNDKRLVILNLAADLRRLSLQLINNLRGRFQIKFAMTHYVEGFTLIELLVVVLIIGVLAAIALPQYQKAVERSRAQEGITLLKTVANAAQAYYLEHGSYPLSFSEMDVEIPWTGTVKGRVGDGGKEEKDARSNENWSLQISKSNSWYNLYLTRISGPYKGSGFLYIPSPSDGGKVENKVLCIEKKSYGFVYDRNKPAGSYCMGILGGKPGIIGAGGYRDYFLN